jgi:signal transduction histidine kinase
MEQLRTTARAGRHGRSILHDLVALVVVTLTPLLVLGGYLAYRNVHSAQETIYTTALGHAHATAGRADEVVAETQALLTGLARTPTVRGGDPERVRALLLEVKASYPYYDDLLTTDANGSIVASASSRPGRADTIVDGAQFQAVSREQRITLGQVQISPRTGNPVLLIGLPIRPGSTSDRTVGEIAATLDLTMIQFWLDDRTLPAGSTITVVDNRTRQVLARSDAPGAWVGRTLPDVPMVRTILTQQEGIVDNMAIDGFTRLNGFATARRAPWSVLVGIPMNLVEVPIAREGRLVALRLVLAAAVAVALATVTVLWIVRPLRALTFGANAIAAGDLGYRITVRRRDEIGQVAAAMNRMADQLIGSLDAVRREQERLHGAVAQVGRALTSATDPETILTPLIEAAVALTRADEGILALADGTPTVTTGTFASPTPDILTLLQEIGDVQPTPSADGRPVLYSPALVHLGIYHCLVARARVNGDMLGTLLVVRRRDEPFGPAEEQLLRTFADQVAVALEQARLRREAAQAAALRELQRLQSEFLITVSHELRAPIAGMKGYAEMLQRTDLSLDDQTRRECLAGIVRYGDRLTVQVRTFFDAMRAGAGQLTLRHAPVDLVRLAASVVHDFALRSRLHEVRLLAAPELPLASADQERVEDVLTNLLDNAIKYSPDGGAITVAIDEEGRRDERGMLHVVVRDSGVGIPPEMHERIFERFFRLDRLMLQGTGGAGLGLFLCRAYVKGMGGRIWVESAPDCGSAFHFTLPIAAPAGEDPAAHHGEVPAR